MKTLRVLMVTYTFPPDAEVGSIRIAHLCRRLPDYGIEPIVLTAREQQYESLDPSRGVPTGVRVLRTKVLSTPLDWYKGINRFFNASCGPAGSERNLSEPNEKQQRSQLRQAIFTLLQTPDRYGGWYPPAIRRAQQLLREEHVNAVFSSGPPWTCHLVARHLKKKFHLPWLMDFRDPWASFVPDPTKPSWWRQMSERMEGNCVRTSDLVLCNTDRLRKAFQLRYPDLNALKFQTLTNGFGDLSAAPSIPREQQKRLLLHLGSLYGYRRIDGFLTALASLVRSGRVSPESFRVVFQGDTDPRYLAEASKIVPDLLASDCVQFRDRVNWEQARQLLWESDVLLLFQGSHTLQVPAKFYEYLQTGIPILAVADEGALTDAVQATESGIWVQPGDPRDIADGLLRALEMPKHSPIDVRKRLSDRYDYGVLAKQLSSWIRGLANDN